VTPTTNDPQQLDGNDDEVEIAPRYLPLATAYHFPAAPSKGGRVVFAPKHQHPPHYGANNMQTMEKIGSIADDTVLLPEIAADKIITELAVSFDRRGMVLPVADGLAEKLAEKAESFYQTCEAFRDEMQADGTAGRDSLYAWMRLWLAAEYPFGSDVQRNLPPDFCVGVEAI
jgi:hypothetical protein